MVHTPQTGTPCTSTEHPIGSPYDKTEALFCFRRLPSSILYFSLPVRFVSLPAVSSWNTDTSYKLHGFLYPLHGLWYWCCQRGLHRRYARSRCNEIPSHCGLLCQDSHTRDRSGWYMPVLPAQTEIHARITLPSVSLKVSLWKRQRASHSPYGFCWTPWYLITPLL